MNWHDIPWHYIERKWKCPEIKTFLLDLANAGFRHKVKLVCWLHCINVNKSIECRVHSIFVHGLSYVCLVSTYLQNIWNSNPSYPKFSRSLLHTTSATLLFLIVRMPQIWPPIGQIQQITLKHWSILFIWKTLPVNILLQASLLHLFVQFSRQKNIFGN